MTPATRKPWLSQYDAGLPEDIELEHPTALAMFAATAAAAPNAPLIHYLDATLTVAEVDRLSDGLAVGLQDLGFRPGDRLGVYVQNVPQFLIAMLAAWKAGGVMVSINPMNRARELSLLLGDSGARALVCLESLYGDVVRGVLQDNPVPIVVTTSELDFVQDASQHRVLAGVTRQRHEGTHDLLELAEANRERRPAGVTLGPDDVAILTYTSGTTGPPKGAMNTHRNVVFNAQAYRDWIQLGNRDVILGIAPLFHITGLIGHIAVAFLIPAPLVLGLRFDAITYLELIQRYRVTFTIGSITVFVALMNEPAVDRYDISSMTKVYSGGQAVPAATLEAFEKRFGVYIHIAYGLTETTSPSHFVPLNRRAPVDATSGSVSVGVPIFNTMARVLGEDGAELPPGEVGEICVAGPQVVPGYWEKPDETVHALPGGELHTGDVGFMDEQGWFYVVDRRKDMINASGYKVWPREVEDVLYQHPAVREAAVVGVPDAYRGETVRAYVSFFAGQSATAAELRDFCKERMAAYKYPRQIEILDDLPKTVTGKILRRDLRDQATKEVARQVPPS